MTIDSICHKSKRGIFHETVELEIHHSLGWQPFLGRPPKLAKLVADDLVRRLWKASKATKPLRLERTLAKASGNCPGAGMSSHSTEANAAPSSMLRSRLGQP
jgi:hypothetical protein